MPRQNQITNLQLKKLVRDLAAHQIAHLESEGKRLNFELDKLKRDYDSLCAFYQRELAKPRPNKTVRRTAKTNIPELEI